MAAGAHSATFCRVYELYAAFYNFYRKSDANRVICKFDLASRDARDVRPEVRASDRGASEESRKDASRVTHMSPPRFICIFGVLPFVVICELCGTSQLRSPGGEGVGRF